MPKTIQTEQENASPTTLTANREAKAEQGNRETVVIRRLFLIGLQLPELRR